MTQPFKVTDNRKGFMYSLMRFVTWPLRVPFVFLISHFMPPKTKRAILISSLYYLLFSDDSQKVEEALRRINELFEIVDVNDALKLPIEIREILWSCGDVNKVVEEQGLCDITKVPSEPQLRLASEKLVACAPKCLHYGRRADMLEDFLKLLMAGALNSAKKTC